MRWLSTSIAGCFILAAVGLLFCGSDHAIAKGKGKPKPKVELKVKVGDAAPAFESVDDAGKPVKSSDLIGKKIIVLYFYPSDFTGNGVAQARGYQDEFDNLTKAGAIVVGVSGDSADTHKLFKAYYKLSFTLLADEKGDAAKAFGIPVGKGGKSPTINAKDEKSEASRGVTIERWTVVIDKEGKIAAIDAVPPPKSSIGDDGKRVLAIVKKLDAK